MAGQVEENASSLEKRGQRGEGSKRQGGVESRNPGDPQGKKHLLGQTFFFSKKCRGRTNFC